ncbi:DUF2304 domain-containing protein [Pseudomarimonas arenosa]|uniref:DUF2304 domain-containing protein n=1 Tax=Pseudomarimonas arenosa TaxID=2774145 RepID=A0AAW3ZQE8_9GAMM|nr:DUF2304 domain-containing protein [Pseudomarimonas arenosa]MBD8527327.1 DUF2304 domain-containing protein [Pseudomarimonas arenosa]
MTAALLGVVLAGSILYLVRRDQLHGIQAIFWLMVAGAALGFGLYPRLVDRLGQMFGVQYPPILLVMLAVIGILIKLLLNDLELARKERRLRRLTQKLAILEQEMRSAQLGTADPDWKGRPTDNSGVDRNQRAAG